ncbi:MAG: hypothetical protein FVQ82_03325 [Planctomycetes bacterium]|nr:hypothetical protein [Planctomycetota bacterium]
MIFACILCWFWTLIIFASFIGWGGLVGRIVFGKQIIDAGHKACWGVSLFILGGGILNLYGLIYKELLFFLVGMGLLLFFIDTFKEKKQTIHQLQALKSKDSKYLIKGVMVVLFLLFFNYTYSIYAYNFNGHDDYHAYLVHPMKMIQSHTLGADPFNDRQMLSSFGGMSFLQTLIVSVFPIEFINSMDRGIGVLLVVVLLASYKEKLSSLSSRLFLIAIFLTMPLSVYVVNTAGVILPIALFLSLFRLIDGPLLTSGKHLKNAIIVALTASAICALKSDTIPFAAIFVCAGYLLRTIRSGKFQTGIFVELCLVGFFVIIMLSPWMVSMYKSCGTAFYPILGKGYHASAYGTFSFHSDPWSVKKIFWFTMRLVSSTYVFTFLVLAGFCLYLSRKKAFAQPLLLSVIITVISGIVLLTYASGYMVFRHSLAFLTMAIIVLLAELTRSALCKETRLLDRNCIMLFIAAGLFLSVTGNGCYSVTASLSSRAISLLSGTRAAGPDEKKRYRQAQNAVPESEVILARLQKPFLLDFQRNTVYVSDWPGDISLPPGLPLGIQPQAVADYFTLNSIRYIAYSYANEAGFSKKTFGHRLQRPAESWINVTAKKTFDFQDNLAELMKTRKLIYDDGDICIIDLQQKANGL